MMPGRRDARARAAPVPHQAQVQRMPRIHFGTANPYLLAGMVLLGIGALCAAWMYLAWPVPGNAGFLLGWGIRAGFLGGVVLYGIGRIVQVIRSRTPG